MCVQNPWKASGILQQFLNGVSCFFTFEVWQTRAVLTCLLAIAFIFTGYILSFVVDLLPSVRTRRHVPQGEKHIELAQGRNDHASEVVIEEPLTMDSTGPSAGYYRGQRI